jgi:hypothetical protein
VFYQPIPTVHLGITGLCFIPVDMYDMMIYNCDDLNIREKRRIAGILREKAREFTMLIRNMMDRIRFASWTSIVVFFIICFISFGLLSASIGYYLDDWFVVYAFHSLGSSGLWYNAFYETRPFNAWVYEIVFSLFGANAAPWHYLFMGVRWLTVAATWMWMRRLWPHQTRQVTWAAVLFAVYPIYKQQAHAITYIVHWTALLLFAVSLWLMVESIRRKRGYWWLTVVALAASLVQLVTVEYFFGLELLRPLLLAILVFEILEAGFWVRLRKAAQLWLPYLLIWGIGMYWRLRMMPLPGGVDRNTPALLRDIIADPLNGIYKMVQMVLQGFTDVFVTTWYKTFSASLFNFSQISNLKSLLIILVVAAGLFFYLWRFQGGEESDEGAKKWVRQSMLIGLAAAFLGILPGWLIGQQVYSTEWLGYRDRFGLAAMFGVSLVYISLMEYSFSKQKLKLILLCLLVGVSMSFHIRYINDYRWSWTKQTRFYWQLLWRAPSIEPGTTIYTSGELFNYVGLAPTSFAINSLYEPQQSPPRMDYWLIGLDKEIRSVEPLEEGETIVKKYRGFVYKGFSRDSFAIYYEPRGSLNCLWVLGPNDLENPELPQSTLEVLDIVDLDLIKPDFAGKQPVDIIGPPQENWWCYYFQKGDLARQYQDWEGAVALWDEAAARDLRPANGVEYVPFIEAHAHMGMWEQAAQMTLRANVLTAQMPGMLCGAWERILDDTPASDARNSATLAVNDELACIASAED